MKALLAVAVFSMLWATSCDEPASSPTREQPTQQAQAPVVVTPPRVPSYPFLRTSTISLRRCTAGASLHFELLPMRWHKGGTRVPTPRGNPVKIFQEYRFCAGWVRSRSYRSNSDGKGVLEIAVAPGVHVKTWNNDLSDSFGSANTLIDPLVTPLRRCISNEARRRGSFFGNIFSPAHSDCVREGSVTLREGSMTDPEFIFRPYASVSAAAVHLAPQ